MPVKAAPSNRSTRKTIASDHAAVRRVRQPMAMNKATYATLPTAAAMYAGPAAEGAPAMTAASAQAGAIVIKATMDPPTQRPNTICQVGVGDNQVKWNVPARTSAPSTESPITNAAIGITNEKIPSAATLANARSRVGKLSTARANNPKSNAPAHGNRIANQRFGGMHDCHV